MAGMTLRFLGEFLRHPHIIGAIVPSSAFLSRKMVECVDLRDARAVVEYGPGTGIFTGFILESLPAGATFFAIEVNPVLARIFRERHPRVALYEDSVGNLKRLCEHEGISKVDCIISGLPWASFSSETQTKYLDAMGSVLRPGGQFVTFAYLHGLRLPGGQRFRKQLRRHFSEVSRSEIVWLNLPPAFVYRCRR